MSNFKFIFYVVILNKLFYNRKLEFQRKIHEEMLTISDTSGSLDTDTTDDHNEVKKDQTNHQTSMLFSKQIAGSRPVTGLAINKLGKQNSFSASDHVLNKDRAQIQYTSSRNLTSCNHFKKIEHKNQVNSRLNDFKFSTSSIETGEENLKRIYLNKSDTNYGEKNTGN